MSQPTWTADELDRIGGAEEIAIAPRRLHGTLHESVPISARGVPLRLKFRWAQSCRPRSGGNPAGGFILRPARR